MRLLVLIIVGYFLLFTPMISEAAGPTSEIKTYGGVTQRFLDIYDYALNVGKVPEKEQDLDFWLMVTAPETEEQIEEQERLGEMELLSQIVQAEAGNQDLTGKRLVADVILNRVDSPLYPNSIEEVIFQEGQFQPVSNGTFWNAAWDISDESFQAAWMEMNGPRLDNQILYFATWQANGVGHWKHGGHWFSY